MRTAAAPASYPLDAEYWGLALEERRRRLLALEGLLTDVPVPGGRPFARYITSALELDAAQALRRAAALREHSQHLHGVSALRALTLPSVGHQLVPSQNRQYVHRLAWLYLLLRASYLSFLWRWLGLPRLLRLRERLLVVEEEEEEEGGEGKVKKGGAAGAAAPPTIGTVLEAAPSSDMTYNAGAEVLGVFRVRAALVVCLACAINLAAWTSVLGQSYLPQGAPAQGASYMLSWALDVLVLLMRAMTQQRPSYMGFGVVAIFIAFIAAIAFALTVLDRLPVVLPYSGTGKGDLPSVMPLIADVRNTPFAMVSYAWGSPSPSPYAETARALAAALPNAWVDVHMMSSGSSVPQLTAEVAKSAHLLVLVLTRDYLHSKNCAIELTAALLHRGSHQATWAYAPPGAGLPEAVLRHLSARLGVRVFSSLRQLLLQAGHTIYRVSAKEDVARLTRWFAVHADARESVSRNFRLPPPAIQRGSALPCGCGGRSGSRYRLCRPRGAVFAGHCYLAPDALEAGRSCVWVAEQVLLGVCALALGATLALLQQGYILNVPIGATEPWDVPLSVWMPLPLIIAAIVVVIVAALLPFALHLDVRTHHSAQLLPLCAAAFIDSYDGGLQEEAGEGGCCGSGGGSGRGGGGGGGSGGSGGSRARAGAAATAVGAAPAAPSAAAPASSGGGGSGRQLDGHITFLFCIGDAPAEGRQPRPDPHLLTRLDNTMAFMRELGLSAEKCAYGAAHPAPPALQQHQVLCVAVFVLRSRADAEHWLRTHCGVFSLSNTILLWDGHDDANSAPVRVERARGAGGAQLETLHLNDYIYLTASQPPAPPAGPLAALQALLSPARPAPYQGFADMLLDHIGAKIGSAYLSALRQQVHEASAEAQGGPPEPLQG